jgi:hypothetical protein
MPLAALFIGGVLPAQLESLIRKRAGYMKYNLWLIQPVVEGRNFNKLQASSYKLQA